jgi:hypothetical protein
VSAYFALSCAIALGTAIVLGTRALFGAPVTPSGGSRVSAIGLLMGFGFAWLQTARLLWARRRAGAYWAFAALVAEVAQWLGESELPTPQIVSILGTVVAIGLAWDDLRD